MKFDFGQAVSEEKMFKSVDDDENGQTTEPSYTISSPMSLKAQVS